MNMNDEIILGLHELIKEDTKEIVLPIRKYVTLEMHMKYLDYAQWAGSKPRPPISQETYGFFSSSKTYDHHAPEYLEKLKKWEERSPSMINQSISEIIFQSMYGPIKIIKGNTVD